MAEFALRMCHKMHQMQGVFLFEHPEWLGAIPAHRDRDQTRSVPSSIFFNPMALALVKKAQALQGTIHQCKFGSPQPKPTRFLTTFWSMQNNNLFALGPISMDANHNYLGPQKVFGHSHPRRLPYSTGGTEAYPGPLNSFIALHLCQTIMQVSPLLETDAFDLSGSEWL